MFKRNECTAILSLLKLKYKYGYKRTIYYQKKTIFQVLYLRRIYRRTRYPSSITRENISLILKIPERNIQTWFHNERIIERSKGVDINIHYDIHPTGDIDVQYLFEVYFDIFRINMA